MNITTHGFNCQYLQKIFYLFEDDSYMFTKDLISYEAKLFSLPNCTNSHKYDLFLKFVLY